MDPRQYARHGHSTTHALIYLMQVIHEAEDSGNCSVRIFYADFTKGFDIIDHNILLNELNSLKIDQTMCFWIRAFLTNRTQAERIGSSLSSWKRVHMEASHRGQNYNPGQNSWDTSAMARQNETFPPPPSPSSLCNVDVLHSSSSVSTQSVLLGERGTAEIGFYNNIPKIFQEIEYEQEPLI